MHKAGGRTVDGRAGRTAGALRRELGDEKADVRTVHRLDRAVSGLMVLARGAAAASELSRQVREGEFEKHYMAVVHGEAAERAMLTDLLYRDKARKMTFVTDTPAKGVQEAVLDYEREWYADGLSEVYITLHTGRTHQIRVQFASRGLPLIGERKYCEPRDECPLALFSCELGFTHPATGERMPLQGGAARRMAVDGGCLTFCKLVYNSIAKGRECAYNKLEIFEIVRLEL